MKRFDTLDNEYTSLIFKVCALIDAGAPAQEIEAARAKRDAAKAELRRRDASFDRWEC